MQHIQVRLWPLDLTKERGSFFLVFPCSFFLRKGSRTSCHRDSVALEMGGTQSPSWNRALVTLWEQGPRFLFCGTTLRKRAHSNGHNKHLFHQAAARLPSSFTTLDRASCPAQHIVWVLKESVRGSAKGGASHPLWPSSETPRAAVHTSYNPSFHGWLGFISP